MPRPTYSTRELRFLLCWLCLLAPTEGGFIQLVRVVRYLNGDAKLLNLGRYGNYCGVGGSGMPKDAVDRCCKVHDGCYSQVKEKVCSGAYGLLVPYKWSKKEGKEKAVICDNNIWGCSRSVCECDRDLSVCFREMSESYREEHVRGNGGLLGFFTTLLPEAGLLAAKGAVSTLKLLWTPSQQKNP